MVILNTFVRIDKEITKLFNLPLNFRTISLLIFVG